jgi:hypothetical protein
MTEKRFNFAGKRTISFQLFLVMGNKKYLLLVFEPLVMLS